MKANIHPIERIARIVVGLAVASLAYWGPHNPWFLLGFVPVLTGLVGWCPPYALLGINTAKMGCCGGCKNEGETPNG